jgi:hypothetical protein
VSAYLETILDDLRSGLAHRAAMRRRRARTAGATATTATALIVAALVSAPFVTHPAPAAAGDGTLTARLLAGDSCPDGIACLPRPADKSP